MNVPESVEDWVTFVKLGVQLEAPLAPVAPATFESAPVAPVIPVAPVEPCVRVTLNVCPLKDSGLDTLTYCNAPSLSHHPISLSAFASTAVRLPLVILKTLRTFSTSPMVASLPVAP